VVTLVERNAGYLASGLGAEAAHGSCFLVTLPAR
jgi:hypothetical protein